ncbi:MAG: coproporphyrinogen III oxidase [Mariprofundaceae bacterium]
MSRLPAGAIPASSPNAADALMLVSALQRRFADRLTAAGDRLDLPQSFAPATWLRDAGRHGGGNRLQTADGPMIGRGSINVSQVHYDDDPGRRLGAATALSTIIHPVHPLAPSVHIHISFTEPKQGGGYWRIMADLNPAIPNPDHAERFLRALKEAAPAQFDEARAQGERYFFIPALGRHRGIAHFYLEQYATDDAKDDARLARRVGETAIDTYAAILEDALRDAPEPDDAMRRQQLAYHTLYFFQVLTLDRGTTTGLLAHDQNDLGIMGSLPPRVDRQLLASWIPRMTPPQDALLRALIDALPTSDTPVVDEAAKLRLAAVVRTHYRAHPEAIAMQASGDVVPPTLAHHGADPGRA